MKEISKNFPKEPIEIEVEFPPNYDATIHVIDFAIKINEYVFIFECKTTSMP